MDIPSGVNGDTGEVSGACTKADVTSTFAAHKVGMLGISQSGLLRQGLCGEYFYPKLSLGAYY